MAALNFRIEWEDSSGVSHPALARSWARLSIDVSGQFVTTVFDSRTGGTRTGVYGPAFLVAEWAVRNFWFLLHEGAPTESHPAWLRRHALSAAREGNSLPDLRVYRDEARVIVEWHADRETRRNATSFVTTGREELDPSDARVSLTQAVDLILERVSDIHHPDVAALCSDWSAVTSLSGSDARLAKRAARTGLDIFDPDDLSEPVEQLLMKSLDRLPEPMGEDFLDAGITKSRLAPSLGALTDAVATGATRLGAGEPRNRIDGQMSGRAAERGYAAAHATRAILGHASDTLPELDDLLKELGFSGFLVHNDSLQDVDEHVQAAVGMVSGAPRVVAPRKRPTQERFLTTRALYMSMIGATASSPRLVTAASSSLQAASRAFAAELLAPAAFLRRRVESGIDDELIENLAEECQVSPMVVKHQIENHALCGP